MSDDTQTYTIAIDVPLGDCNPSPWAPCPHCHIEITCPVTCDCSCHAAASEAEPEKDVATDEETS